MKTLITLIAAALFTSLSSFAFSAAKPEPVKFVHVESIIDQYIEAMTKGETEYLNSLFTHDFKLTTPSNTNSKPVTKNEIIKYLKTLQDVKLLCETDYSFVEKNNDCSIVKVTSSFDNFERIDYLTVCNSELGWKISNVVVAYPEK